MRSVLVLAFVFSAFLAGCSSSNSPASAESSAESALSTLPATVEGTVIFDVIEGDDEFGDYANWNFGTLTIGSEDVLVEADGEVLRQLKIPEMGGRVRATISSVRRESGEPMYKVTSIESL